MGAVELAIFHAFEYDFRKKFAAALAKGLVGSTGSVREFATRLQSEFGKAEDAQAEFGTVAGHMHEALLEAYETTVESEKKVASYQNPAGTRLTGALRRALQDDSMVTFDGKGISYLNLALLDSAARHWRRLNFGTQGTRVTANATNYYEAVRFDGRVLFYAGSRAPMSRAFGLPPGRFIDPRTNLRVPYGASANSAYSGGSPTVDRFFPGGGGRHRIWMTGGIDPRHFIDAGFIVLQEEFPLALDRLFAKWTFAAQESAKPSPPLTIHT